MCNVMPNGMCKMCNVQCATCNVMWNVMRNVMQPNGMSCHVLYECMYDKCFYIFLSVSCAAAQQREKKTGSAGLPIDFVDHLGTTSPDVARIRPAAADFSEQRRHG